jgi:glycosyltransferase involved in cell wall biosynthesis
VVHAAGGGVVVACDDVDGFAAALLKFARDPDAAARAGARNQRHVREYHSSGTMVRRVAEVYDALLTA